ncbi:pyridoxamine 5'-phosphate oxidase family protein [Microbacterium sp. Marseille-Q6965]|uniref:pyridoxamine 5'-phosphate oxidase family protein n=1 Tax=Microbacterium sp. Marseille-Q6965 TaxID=2965072 RepID=UPI0021B71DD8|nr:pyridoxamine 5'-phosphate oxidase family protein [Microbacterium sp. Marseille-Q6965]
MIITLSEQASLDLLSVASVGRFGFLHDDQIQIIPVNYQLHGSDIVVRTTADGVLSTLPHADGPVSFQVDHQDGNRGVGWSVLMHGSVEAMDPDQVSAIEDPTRVIPWAGGTRELHLRFRPASVSGRRVRRERDDAGD